MLFYGACGIYQVKITYAMQVVCYVQTQRKVVVFLDVFKQPFTIYGVFILPDTETDTETDKNGWSRIM